VAVTTRIMVGKASQTPMLAGGKDTRSHVRVAYMRPTIFLNYAVQLTNHSASGAQHVVVNTLQSRPGSLTRAIGAIFHTEVFSARETSSNRMLIYLYAAEMPSSASSAKVNAEACIVNKVK
jgi:hypothetical protein